MNQKVETGEGEAAAGLILPSNVRGRTSGRVGVRRPFGTSPGSGPEGMAKSSGSADGSRTSEGNDKIPREPEAPAPWLPGKTTGTTRLSSPSFLSGEAAGCSGATFASPSLAGGVWFVEQEEKDRLSSAPAMNVTCLMRPDCCKREAGTQHQCHSFIHFYHQCR